MEAGQDFLQQLEDAVQQKKDQLEKNQLNQIKEKFRLFQSGYTSIYNVLLKKGLIQDDPYKYEQKISDVKAPDSSPFIEAEKNEKMSIRLSDYESQLDFLINYYQFSLEFLTLKRIKSLVEFINYIQWERLSPNSNNANTRYLAEFLERIKQGSDSVSGGILSNSQMQLAKIKREIMGLLKQISEFQRERYKLVIREIVLPDVAIAQNQVLLNTEEVVGRIKRRFVETVPETPFYPELVREILTESYGEGSEGLKKDVLEKLKVEQLKQTKKKGVSYKAMLLEAIRILSTCTTQIDSAVRKILEAHNILTTKKKTLMDKFKSWLGNLSGRNDKKFVYELEFFDPVTSSKRTRQVDFVEFTEKLNKRIKILSAAGNKLSNTFQRLQDSDEEKIFEFLNTNFADLQEIYQTLPALDNYFKSEVSREERSRLKGIKIEMNAINNALIKTKQKKHDYVAQKEEAEQLKRLGITSD